MKINIYIINTHIMRTKTFILDGINCLTALKQVKQSKTGIISVVYCFVTFIMSMC